MAADGDPIAEFRELFERAKKSEASDASAGALATADAGGRPAVRMVLLKGADERGFVFYTNRQSGKARDLAANPRAALCFYWPSLHRQVRIEGTVGEVDGAEADTYFASRPRLSQIGAWTSKQSAPLASRAVLMARFLEMQARFAGRQVPRPPFWGGYRLAPERIEFWRNQLHRLHDRLLWVREDGGWSRQRLYP